jgi:hypothetical protein
MQAIQFWYQILDKELKRHVRHIILNQLMQPTLANASQILKCIEFNMVENQVVTLKFNMDVPWNFLTNSSQLGSSQCNPLTKFKVPQKETQTLL